MKMIMRPRKPYAYMAREIEARNELVGWMYSRLLSAKCAYQGGTSGKVISLKTDSFLPRGESSTIEFSYSRESS